ncbi:MULTISPECIES: SCO5717 family growth-regulating ATPase [unclassified Streptomyces]|uniref:SCO5717 family growth-regulating ATPase n=1 Tax=unclassified Streptomyces TaxID=2593676 RepID=UPI000DDB0908|nr:MULTISPECIES: SCO5717 family growth-regulating ATPase [unclassified Streptomyces]QZZ29674.1 NACHT domain-containing protein [Streptomyces sp. ST1015]
MTGNLALDSASVVTALGGILVALIAAGVALWQMQRAQSLEREKIQLEHDSQLRLRQQEWDHDRQLTEREQRKADREAAREVEQAAARVAEHRSTLEDAAALYCARLVQELSTLKILDMSRPLRLERLYVQVGVQEQQPLRFLSADELDRDEVHSALDATGAFSIDYHPPAWYTQNAEDPGESRARAERARAAQARVAAEVRAAATHTYIPVDALNRYRRIVVVGDPGAGKTTMLRHLALRLATDASQLPAYVELFRFVESGNPSLLDYLADHWSDHYGFDGARDYLTDKLADGTAVLLLDGLDEVLGGENAQDAENAYRRVTAEIARLATRFPRALIATTCRRQGWRGGLPQFQVLEALDFEWPQIETFVANWFGTTDRRRAGLVRALSANGRLQTLAANPLLLSLIAIVYERDLELPERRAALYQRCVEVLLREWDAHREITRYSRFTTDRKQDLLKELARHYHQRGLRYFPEDDLLDQIDRFLPTIDLDPADSRTILDEISTQYGLLKPQAHGWYGFLHLTLQEHFTAAALLERGAEGIRQAVGARYDPWWEEVILLLAGALPDATPLLAGVLQLGERRDVNLLDLPDDDFFHTDLLLAARCLTGSPRVADVGLRRQIVAAVWELLDRSPHPDEKRRAAEALVGVLRSDEQLDDVIAYICDVRRADEARIALVEALEAHGGRRVGERLLGAFALCRGELRDALISALGTLRVAGAVGVLRTELDGALESAERYPSNRPRHALRAGRILRALGPENTPTDLLLRAVEACGGQYADPVAPVVRELLKDRAEPGLAERLLHHFVLRGAGGDLAGAYLDAAGDDGVRVLLDQILAAGMRGGAEPMRAVRDHIAGGRGHAHRDMLLDLVHRRAVDVEVRVLALEALDHCPGDPGELEELLDHYDLRVQATAAATLAAWGAPVRLDVIRTAILSNRTVPGEQGDGAVWDTDRIVTTLTPYGLDAVVAELRSGVEQERPEGQLSAARAWLYVLSPEDEVDDHLDRLRLGRSRIFGRFPARVPPSRAEAVFRYFQDTPSAATTGPRRDHETLLTLAATSAEGPTAVAWLVRFLPGGDLAGPHFPQAHHHAYEAARRARVRILRDRTIQPVPVTRDAPPASPVPPPPA